MLISVNLEIHGSTRSINRHVTQMWDMHQLQQSPTFFTTWALRDAETSKTTAYGKPPIVIVNKDDLKIDILIGNATGAHGTNALYVQLKSYEEERKHNSATAQTTKRVIRKECAIN